MIDLFIRLVIAFAGALAIGLHFQSPVLFFGIACCVFALVSEDRR